MTDKKIILRPESLALVPRLIREQARLDKIRAGYIRRIKMKQDLEAGLIDTISGFCHWTEDD